MMNHHDNVYYQWGFLQSILTSNGVPMALAHLNLQVKKNIFLVFPLFVLLLQQLKLKLLFRVMDESISRLRG